MNLQTGIPSATIAAAVAVLSPYVGNITAPELVKALQGIGETKAESNLPESPLTVQKTAEILGVSKITVHRYMNDGKLERIKLGYRTARVSAVSVRKLLNPSEVK